MDIILAFNEHWSTNVQKARNYTNMYLKWCLITVVKSIYELADITIYYILIVTHKTNNINVVIKKIIEN